MVVYYYFYHVFCLGDGCEQKDIGCIYPVVQYGKCFVSLPLLFRAEGRPDSSERIATTIITSNMENTISNASEATAKELLGT